MANKKKQSKVSKKKTKNTGISTEFSNLITIFIGVFLLYGLNSTSMGLIGSMTQEVFKGLFGSLAILIPILIILVGVLGFFDNNEYVFRLKKSKVYYIAIIFIFIFYGLLNSNLIPVDNPLRPEMISSIMKVAVENQGIGLITSIIVYFIKEIFGITGGWLISLFALFLSILFVFNISIQDLIFAIKNKSTNPKNSNANFKDMLKNLKESALDIITDEVDDTTMVEEKTGFFKKLMKDKDKKQNQQEFVPNEDNEDYNEYDDEKTVKIVGFNQADDDVLEILEGTQTVDYTQDDLKELNDLMRGKTNTQSTLEETNDYSDTLFNTNVNTKNNSDLEQLQFNLPSDKKQENISNGSSSYKKPSINCLKNYNGSKNSYKEQNKSKEVIDTLKNFNIEIQDCNATFGPTITRYEVSPKPGTKVSKIVNLSDDLALSLAARSIRIEAPVPGKSVIGIEVPNDKPQVVGLREVITSNEFINDPSSLAVGLGKEISGKPLIADLAKMPHLLIAGATGSGKSVCVNTIITSLLYKSSPEEVKLLLIDPKVVELAHYNGIPHLLSPVVTDPKKASNALNWAVNEMNKRYQLFAENGVKDIAGYNRKCENKMHKIVIIIDELADLMMACGNEVEDYICRLAQMARAAGMHLIIATQRPSVDVITGIIKANIPSRIAFAVSSQTDSRTILDMGGAEKLLGKGDMLYYPLGAAKPVRIQGAFISEEESEKVIDEIKAQKQEEVKYEEEIMETISRPVAVKDNDVDEFLEEAIDFVVSNNQGSASMLQRKFKIGFNRAARLIDSMEERGIVGPSEGSKPRKVLITKEELENLKRES
ncbi:DNA segregation ATPase FtsK/SpoIIIE, S-DNA-T family [Intestinibacter bartlettii DSM 16795]|uniref:FtsK/SpoIIIE family DNA translocase n=1 Tax=Intestinibacter bartlettii TaxID=261299 RepID=UPI00016315E9|nr:DNA translocase FtsK [Intestinibacter bartlettii]MDU1252946.1 DNA translocase FtsK 4TM domain-containing protein [Peptostreptococcaceae bacterium]SCI36958.1 Stage III sporulation protein E [uncultured Clostridium sp.]EDQ96383.1 FtsK/SpoIIIE family protein [Intestinibacter bartlettii DSM 16795]MDU2694737.1 DNA translocase FtsK 4TM domain-containing protein [Intestinibacter bartlettii]MDU4257074.1 DNA translocase FtsK 4TM domain-containing protein [Intestinibacter bartlettii]